MHEIINLKDIRKIALYPLSSDPRLYYVWKNKQHFMMGMNIIDAIQDKALFKKGRPEHPIKND